MRDRDQKSRLRRDGKTAAVDRLKNFIAAAVEQRLADIVAELFGIG
jgi:hypothetical protein